MIPVGRNIRQLWPFVKPHWPWQLLLLAVMLALACLGLALPIAIQYMIDTLIPSLSAQRGEVDLRPVFWFGGVLIGIYLAHVLFGLTRDYLAGRVGADIINSIRSRLFGHLQKMSLKFYADHQVGEIMSRLLSDVGRIQEMVVTTFLMFLTDVFLLVAALAYLMHTNWQLTLIAVIPLPVTVLATGLFGKRLNRVMQVYQRTIAELSARLQETLLGTKTIRSFGQEAREQARVDEVIHRTRGLVIRTSVISSLASNLVQFISMVGPIVVLAWGVFLVSTGGMKLGELIAFYILLSYLYSPVQGIAGTYLSVQTAMASVDRVFEYLNLEPDIVEAKAPAVLASSRGEVALQGVSFGYGSSFRLEKVDLSVRPREKVALVGPSGSGKTTLVNLIMRFFDPERGVVMLDGVDLRGMAIASLRKHVALVEQEPMLFRMSVFDNIAYGYPTASEAEVVAAAKGANIHEFIMGLPDGYRTEVGERGVTVSGGERQRLCLARAILKNPSVLILDEATSALDSNAEQLIRQSLATILADKTAIIIAHRLSTVQHVDRIVALDGGRIVDQGTHEELTGRCELYRELARKQLLL